MIGKSFCLLIKSRCWRQLTFTVLLSFVVGGIISGCAPEQDENVQAQRTVTAAAKTQELTASVQKETDSNQGWYPGTIKVGHLVALDMAPLFVAKEAGYFTEEGLDVETVFFSNPGDNNAALTGGAIQFSINPFTLPYFAQNSGIPMRIISSAGGLGVIQVVIQKHYDVEGMAQLAEWVKAHPGKKLKVATLRGDTLDMVLFRAFKKVGLSYDDFEMVWFNDLLAMVQAFETDQADILSHIQPYTTKMQVEKGARFLTDSNRVWGEGTPNCTLDVMEGFLKKYPNTVDAYLKAVYRGFNLIVNNPDKAVELVERGNYYRVSADVLRQSFRTQSKVVLIPNSEGMMKAIDDMVAGGYIRKPEVDILRLDPVRRIGSSMDYATK